MGLHLTYRLWVVSAQLLQTGESRLTCREDLIPDEDTGRIIILLELVQDSGEGRQLGLVPGRCGLQMGWSARIAEGHRIRKDTGSIWLEKSSKSTNR